MNSKNRTVVAVIDSGIFMQRTNPNFDLESTEIYITPEVEAEILSKISQVLYTVFKSKVRISVISPSSDSVRETLKKNNEIAQGTLSNQDLSIVALAWEFKQAGKKVTLYSDDFGIRNLAKFMKICVRGVRQNKIVRKRKYTFTCIACGAIFQEIIDECDVCGHQSFKRNFQKSK